ncbi:zinc finger CCHC domain-containing protein 8 homolog isoform X2 [Pseudomyrmex gracilis]|uniref:zinc finger CCHC domain-containing protein 8 homolog isoform X2 n=1 Tax=Pseudomyrmex gracilis TaxID=219809 RepID=UPI0009949DC4|nr:zinc finger CCHC domain-containing protein 8 homolog isoform X2 [Pseudomyrmex gracilis]
MDGISANSTVAIDSEPEVIELDSTCDMSEITCLTNDSINNSKNAECLVPNAIRSQPVFRVMFRDESVSRQYRQRLKAFLHTLIQSELSHEEDSNESSLVLDIWDNQNCYKESCGNIKYNNDMIHDSLFTIDKQPNVVHDSDVPTYGQKYRDRFEESDSEISKDAVSKLNCFNCNGNHNMRDCPLPRNQANIKKNRKEFAKNNIGNRYHMSEDQRFSHIIPGQLSSKLRKALGLKDNQLPRHIYRMRLLGYPPGWLEEARLQHSGLSLFNSDGIAETDPTEEEGEIITDVDKDQYDLKKIYDFPGFNVPPPPGTVDDSDKYWVPQMQSLHSKEVMLSCLQGKEAEDGYKRKKLKLSVPIVNTVQIPSDMEIEDAEENVPVNRHFASPLPKKLPQLPPPPPPPPPSHPPSPPPPLPPLSTGLFQPITVEDSDSQSQELSSFDSADDSTLLNVNSPSLSDLENTKKELLIQLDDTSSQVDSDYTSFEKNNLKILSNQNFTENSDSRISSDALCKTTTDLNDTYLSNNTPTSPCISRKSSHVNQASLKSVHLGTPILPSTSPYSKLPSSEKFSKNICDVINFENLPDSTGKYEQMSEVLQKVRNTMAKLNQLT